VQSNQGSPESYEYIETTLTWLLNKFKNAQKQFTNLPLRTEWRDQWFTLETTKNKKVGDIIIINDKYNTRLAYRFFLRVSKSQLLCLEELIDFITDQFLPIKLINQAMTPYRMVANRDKSDNVYVFRLTKSATSNAPDILSSLYVDLKKHGYIICSSREFKRLFIDNSHSKPFKSPTPIIWQCEHYNHLAYFVYCLIKNKIITPTKVPSNYKIALHLFNDRYENNFYSPRKERYDGNLNPKDQSKIDSIMKNL
jgi:hypothetical protein